MLSSHSHPHQPHGGEGMAEVTVGLGHPGCGRPRPCARAVLRDRGGWGGRCRYPTSLCSGPLPVACGKRHLTLLRCAPGQVLGIGHQGLEGTESGTFAVLWPGGGQTGEPRVDPNHSGVKVVLPTPDTRRPGSPCMSAQATGGWRGWRAGSPLSQEPLCLVTVQEESHRGWTQRRLPSQQAALY